MSAGVLVGGQICSGLTADHRWERMGSGAELGGSSSRMGPMTQSGDRAGRWHQDGLLRRALNQDPQQSGLKSSLRALQALYQAQTWRCEEPPCCRWNRSLQLVISVRKWKTNTYVFNLCFPLIIIFQLSHFYNFRIGREKTLFFLMLQNCPQ